MPSDGISKSSHWLWQGELKMLYPRIAPNLMQWSIKLKKKQWSVNWTKTDHLVGYSSLPVKVVLNSKNGNELESHSIQNYHLSAVQVQWFL